MKDTDDDRRFDAILPPEMATRAVEVGVKKATLGASETFVLSVLAGAFIAMGAVFSTTVTAGAGDYLPFGLTKLLGGLTFSLGLILVIIAGAELFTGNNLIVMAWASRRVTTWEVLRNWMIVYAGNFVGAFATALLILASKQYEFGQGAVGRNMMSIAAAKCQLGFVQGIALGAACNALVCLAVWLCLSARTTADKVLAIVPPITAFVAAGFEHSVANMYFIPVGLLVKNIVNQEFTRTIELSADFTNALTWHNFILSNLFPVTIGNIIGGAVMVGVVYWFVYLRERT